MRCWSCLWVMQENKIYIRVVGHCWGVEVCGFGVLVLFLK